MTNDDAVWEDFGMTEEEWLVCADPDLMLDSLGVSLGQRKARLFAVACCRAIWPLLDNEPSRQAVDVSERLADGRATNKERRAAAKAAEGHRGTNFQAQQATVFAVGMLSPGLLQVVLKYVRGAAGNSATPNPAFQPLTADQRVARERAVSDTRAAQADRLRDIIGNLFRPVTFEPTWRTSTAVALAQQMYESRDFSLMPILADALQDAGCDHPDILTHCRGDGVHVRGCWVADLLLGKA